MAYDAWTEGYLKAKQSKANKFDPNISIRFERVGNWIVSTKVLGGYKTVICIYHKDAITRKGFDLHFMDSEGKISNWGYSGIKDRESALQRFHEYHEMDPDKYARAIIRDNMTRKEKTYA